MRAPQSTVPPPKKTTSRKGVRLTPERIAQRLHDTICQNILGVRCLVSVLERQVPQEATQLRKQLQEVDTLLGKSSTELRALIKELRTAAEKESAVKPGHDIPPSWTEGPHDTRER